MRARAQKGKSLSFYSVVPFMDLFHISFFLYLFFPPHNLFDHLLRKKLTNTARILVLILKIFKKVT